MKKLVTTLCLAVIGLLATVPVSAEVGDIITLDDINYQIISLNPNEVSVYSVEWDGTGTLDIPSTISDSDNTYTVTQITGQDYDELTGEYKHYGAFYNNGNIKRVNLPNTIISIGDYAFSYSVLEEIALPNSLTNTGKGVFQGCKNLITVKLPNSVTEIGENAFGSCVRLKTVSLPNTIISIGDNAFNSSGIEAIEIPNTVTNIGAFAFWNCKRLKKFSFAENSRLKVIPRAMVADCDSIENISIPNSVEIIGYVAFGNCTSLSYVKIGTGLREFTDDTHGNYSQFGGCTSLKTFEIENCPIENVPIGSMAGSYRDCAVETVIIDQENVCNWHFLPTVKNIVFGKNVKNIGESAFANCSITSLDIPESVVSIGNSAFANCLQLKEVNLPSSLTTIGNNAYSKASLSTLSIPDAVASLGSGAFSNCELLTNVSLSANLKNIGADCFTGCTGITAITLNNQLETIGSSAFAKCAISNIDFPASLTTIESLAFANNKIATLTLPKTLTSIGRSAFSGNPVEKVFVNTNANVSGVFPYADLTEVIFAENAVTIPSLQGATKLRDVTLPESMEMLPSYSFTECVSLQNVYFPDKLTSIGSSAFKDCVSLTELEIPKGVNRIDSYAFANCRGITTFHLPENVTSIADGLFSGCTNLEKVYFSENVKQFGASAFTACIKLRSMVIPAGVTSIPESMLSGCVSLKEILVPNSVTSIGESAFAGCSSLTNIDLGTKLYDIGNYAFEGCGSITDIHSMAVNPPNAAIYSFPIDSYTNATVTVQEQSLTKYTRENPWYRFENYMTVRGAVILSHYEVDMAGDEVFQLGVYGSNSKIEWSSSNPSVAYANDCGLIVAMGITGSTVITATVDGEKINCRVTVSGQKRNNISRSRAGEEEETAPVDIIMEGVSGNPPMVNMRLVPVGSRAVIDWKTSDSSLATVENGIVTVHESGDVEFGAETDNGIVENLSVNTDDIDTSGIEEIFAEDEVTGNSNVYDLTGRCLLINATPEQLNNLKPGIYLYNGQKYLVK